MKKYLLAACLPLLSQCSSGPTQSAESVPTLHNRSLEKAWGRPTREQTSAGHRLTYLNPKNSLNRLTINAQNRLWATHQFPPNVKGEKLQNGELVPTSTPQVFRSATILGNKVNYYQTDAASGTDADRFQTTGIQLKNPLGQTGNYLIEYEGEESAFPKRLSELGW